jgi:hypothetical protein
MAIITLNNNSLINADVGKVLQVITATDSTQRSTTSTSFVTASNTLSVDITPSSTSSKIYIIVSFQYFSPVSQNNLLCTIFRDSTNLGNATNGFGKIKVQADGTGSHQGYGCMAVLDSPSTASQVTYQLYMKTNIGTGKINNDGAFSTITAFEIAG